MTNQTKLILKVNRLQVFTRLLIVFILFIAVSFNPKESFANELDRKMGNLVSITPEKGSFALITNGKPAPLVYSSNDFTGISKALNYFKSDLKMVSGSESQLTVDVLPDASQLVIAGTLGHSKLIDQLVSEKKINLTELNGKWEQFVIQVIENPFPGFEKALVIAGSDKRGTIFGIFELSKQMGVSPWYWWADVPVEPQSTIYVKAQRFTLGEPAVKYRGIFLNDEEPALGRWAVEKFGGFNSRFYEKLFELMLRMKSNFLWPAMWWAAFNSDDPKNAQLADDMGIVMSTSHHEPMMRAHAEWRAHPVGEWNYSTNSTVLKEFWRKGIERMGNKESIVTLAMRGDGDMAMSASTNVALLQQIVEDQRKIITEVTGRPITETPQVWALYKEVQDYYDNGMRVPDDVTLLLCDDNWGNIRKLPKPGEAKRAGGYGIYYHFDYVGDPRNYKWLNTTQIERTWEQMNLAYRHGVDRIWVVNVGDLKPMEFPIEFFLDFAWNPDAWPAERLPEYTIQWATEQFGTEHATEIAEMLDLYTKYNGRRKPELLSPDTYSLINFREAETIVEDYNRLAKQAEALGDKLPVAYKDAFYELVLHPVTACTNLNELYLTVAKNREAAKQGRATANDLAQKAKTLFQKDADITTYYHTKLAGGKWDLMMAQTHIGYTYWQQPEKNVMPEVNEIILPERAEMGIAIQGADTLWTEGEAGKCLPEMDSFNQQSVYIDVFNRGNQPFDFQINTGESWLKAIPASGKVEKENRIWLSADWSKVPVGKHLVSVKIKQVGGKEVTVKAVVNHPEIPEISSFKGFIQSNGFVSMEAEHYTRNVEANGISWKVIPGLGRTLSGVAVFPVNSAPQIPGSNCPHLEYDMYLFQPCDVRVNLYLSPSLNYFNDEGLKLAVSFDDQQPQIISMNKNQDQEIWNKWVSDNINKVVSVCRLKEPGKHTLKIWMANPGVVIQKIVVHTDEWITVTKLNETDNTGVKLVVVRKGEEKPSYLGEPESAVVK